MHSLSNGKRYHLTRIKQRAKTHNYTTGKRNIEQQAIRGVQSQSGLNLTFVTKGIDSQNYIVITPLSLPLPLFVNVVENAPFLYFENWIKKS